MSHSSSLKARRKRQRIKKSLHVEEKQAKRMAKEAAAGPKKEKVKKVRVKKEKVKAEKVAPEKVEKEKKAKAPKDEGGKPAAKKGGEAVGG